MKKNTLIEVEWDDAYTVAVWHTNESMDNLPLVKCRSVGYFVNKDKKVLRMSHSIQTGSFSGRDGTAIPVGCITKIRRLKDNSL